MIGIFYASKYGFTKKVIGLIQDKCNQPSVAVDLAHHNHDIEQVLKNSEKVIIGGSIYMGKIQDSVSEFLEDYKEELLGKEIALFVCGLQDEDTIQIEMNQNFPLLVLDRAKSIVWLGGGVDFEKLHWIDKMITKKVMKITESMETIQHDNIDKIVAMCNQ